MLKNIGIETCFNLQTKTHWFTKEEGKYVFNMTKDTECSEVSKILQLDFPWPLYTL